MTQLVYLQRAQPQNARYWLPLVDADRHFLEHWLPYLKELHNLETATAYVEKQSRLDYYLGSWLYEIWAEQDLVGYGTIFSLVLCKEGQALVR